MSAWCAAGSSAPTPCASGSVGLAAGLASADECRSCPPGYWCSAGKAIPCMRNYFNELPGADDQSFCLPCPENAITLSNASVSFDACVCNKGFFADTRILTILQGLRAADQMKSIDFRLNASLFCHNCVSGAACRAGDDETADSITLETLPLLPGYWRNSPQSLDIRSCGDRASGTTPGCRGGVGEPCKDWLAGPLCTECNVSSGRFYDIDRFECNECDHGSVTLPLAVISLILVAIVAIPALCVGLKIPKRTGLEDRWLRYKPRLMGLGLMAKLKLLASFYQICVNIQPVYSVQFPARVAAVLEQISDLVTLNFEELWKPLQVVLPPACRVSLWLHPPFPPLSSPPISSPPISSAPISSPFPLARLYARLDPRLLLRCSASSSADSTTSCSCWWSARSSWCCSRRSSPPCSSPAAAATRAAAAAAASGCAARRSCATRCTTRCRWR